MFTKTWSNESIALNLPNFQHFCLKREKRKNSMRASGGIIVYIQYTYVNEKSLFFKSEDDMLWLRLGGSIFFFDTDLCIGLCLCCYGK